MPVPRVRIDLTYERERLYNAGRTRVCHEAVWGRGGQAIGSANALDGPFGLMLKEEIERRFASGPLPDVKVDGVLQENTLAYPLRWAQLCALADPSSHPLKQAERELSLLYRKGLDVSGDILSPAWTFLKNRCDLNRTLLRKQAIEIGQGSVAVRPTLRPCGSGQYYPPGLTVVHADKAIAVEDPSRPGHVGAFVEFDRPWSATSSPIIWMGGSVAGWKCTVWCVIDPAHPYWGRWESVEEWLKGADPIDFFQGGLDYPWWSGAPGRSEPIMPVVCSQWDPAATDLLTSSSADLQAVLDLILERTWCHLVKHSGSFQKALIMSGLELSGLKQSMLDPNVILNVFGDKSAQLATIPDSTESAQRLWQMHRDRTLEWSQRYDAGFRVRETTSAQSGAALLIEATGKVLLRQQLETRARPVDTRVVEVLRATWNYLIRSRQVSVRYTLELTQNSVDPAALAQDSLAWTPWLPPRAFADLLIPEGRIELRYPHFWNSLEQQQIAADLKADVDAHLESPRALWLLRHGREDDRPDGPNWQEADDSIRQALADANAYAGLGYGVPWPQLSVIVRQTAAREEERYEVRKDVGTAAAKGLQLREEFPGRALVGLSATRLLRRARSLQAYSPMLIGDVNALHAWLVNHEHDADVPAEIGAWGDDANPSGAYITWLSQGGNAALDWTENILAGRSGDTLGNESSAEQLQGTSEEAV